MELKLFSNSNVNANLEKDLREKMEAKVLAEFPNYTTKASAIEYLLKCAVADNDATPLNDELAEQNIELSKKIEAYETQVEYLKAELKKEQEKPARVVEKQVNIEVPQKVFDADFYHYLKQVAFLVSEDFCPKNDVNALVKRVFEHYKQQGNFIFDAEDEKLLKENGLM